MENLKNIHTRFRAYRLDSAGSSFSYYYDGHFTLIEARITDENRPNIYSELHKCGKKRIDTLHITSWDQDHCSPGQLEEILNDLEPKRIEYPGYDPHTDSGKESLRIIKKYAQKSSAEGTGNKCVQITPEYIDSLENSTSFGYNNILYHPKWIDPENSNNNSTAKQFRSGSFNVLSLGDIEDTNVSAAMRRQKTVYEEVDVMILAHHGADNGFTTSAFLKKVKPKVAIASSNYDNQFEHPKQEIKDRLFKNNIKLFTTKTGDVLIESLHPHNMKYRVINFQKKNEDISSAKTFTSRKYTFLSNNIDNIRTRYQGRNRGPR